MSKLKDLKDMSTAEKNEAVLDFGRKIDGTVGEKVRSAKGWLLKIVGSLLLSIGVIVLLFGAVNAGIGICGVGVILFGSGLRNISMKFRHNMVGLGLFLLGAAFLNYGISEIKQAKRSVDWPSVSGTVTTSEKEKRTTTEGTGSSKRTVTYYSAIIDYTYQVDGKTHTSNRIAFGGQNRHQTTELLNRYPLNKSVDVFYDPDQPAEAVLEKGFKKQGYFFPGFGAVIILFGLVIILFKNRRQTAERMGQNEIHA